MLTKRQKQALDFIKKYIARHDYAPSLEEIKKHLNLTSVSTAHFHVQTLERSGYLHKEENQPRALDVFSEQKLIQIPILGIIAAGQPIEAIEHRENIAIPQGKIKGTGEHFALRVSGESMIEENINDGDIVLVKRQQTAENGQKVVALINNNEVTLKKLYREKKQMRLEPANPKFKSIMVKSDNLKVQGIVVDIIKSNVHQTNSVSSHKTDNNTSKQLDDFLNTVIEDDCLQAMQSLPDKSIDMILCDLPYGHTQNMWDSVIPLEKLWEQYERIIKDSGAIALTSQGIFTAKLILSNQKLFKYKITWVKSKPTNFLNAKKQPLRRHEDICIFYKKQPKYTPQMTIGEPYNKGFRKSQLTGCYGDFNSVEVKSDGGRYPTDVVYFKTAESEGPVHHPTQKPVELGRYLIRTFSEPNSIVLDNTCGSGSFLVAAVLEGRRFIGIEKNKEVFLHKRTETASRKLSKNIKSKTHRYTLNSFKRLIFHNKF